MAKILLVGRDHEESQWLASALSEGHGLALANGIEAALELMSEARPDLMLLGCVPTDAEWTSVRSCIGRHAARDWVPVVLILDSPEVEGCLSESITFADDFLVRPLTPSTVRAKIHTWLTVREQMDSLAREIGELQVLRRAKQATLGLILHDMKSPLTVIQVELDMLDHWRQKGVTEKFQCSRERVAEQCRELASLARSLSDIARLEGGTLELTPVEQRLDTLVWETLEEARSVAEARRVVIQFECPPVDRLVRVDPRHMRSALSQLLGSALKLTGDGGSLYVAVGATGQSAELSVWGDGLKLPSEVHARFFDALTYQERRALGLSASLSVGIDLCRLVVEAQGGQVWLETGIDQQPVFRLRLPCSEQG